MVVPRGGRRGEKRGDSCLVPGRWIGALAALATQASAMLFGVDLIREAPPRLSTRRGIVPDIAFRRLGAGPWGRPAAPARSPKTSLRHNKRVFYPETSLESNPAEPVARFWCVVHRVCVAAPDASASERKTAPSSSIRAPYAAQSPARWASIAAW